MTIKEYKEKRAQLLDQMQTLIDEGKMDCIAAKKSEVENLDAEWEQHKQAVADMNALRDLQIVDSVATGAAELNNLETQAANLGVESKEYRNAFLLNLAGRAKEMTKLENVAFTHTTGDSNAPLPKVMQDKIWDQICGEHCIVGDVDLYRTGVVMEIPVAKSVQQGKAKNVAENAANEDMQFEWDKVTLSGKDFSAHVNLSYAQAKMGLDALEAFINRQIVEQIGEAMAEDIVATIEAGMNPANKVTSAAAKVTTYAELAGVFAKLVKAGTIKVYCKSATMYENLIGLVDGQGRPIFDANASKLLRGELRLEDAVGEHKLLIGDPKRVLYNMVQDIMLEQDKNITKHVYTHAGYARGQGALIFDKAFALLTIKQA